MNLPSPHADRPPEGILPSAQQPSTWFDRNRLWVALLLVVGMVGCFILWAIGMTFRLSYPYVFALRQAGESDIVAGKIGRPIRTPGFTAGSISDNGSSGKANLAIPILGPKGKGRIFVVAKMRDGCWNFETLDVLVDGDHAPISLLGAAPRASAPKPCAGTSPIALRVHPVN